MAPERYTQWGAYCQSKLANVLFAKELDRRFKEKNVKITAVSCHPGGVDTDLARWTISPEGDPQKATQLRKEGRVILLTTMYYALCFSKHHKLRSFF